MTPQDRALICYDDNGVAGNRDHQLANHLMHDLQGRNILAQGSSYTRTPLLDDTYEWLIVIYPSHGVQQPHVAQAINTAMERSVERKMRGVFLLTTSNPSTIPAQWASIRAYDASSPVEEKKAIDGLVQAMCRVKVPYNEMERSSWPLPPSIPVPTPPNPKKPFSWLTLASDLRVIVPVVVAVLVVLSVVWWPKSSDITQNPTTSKLDTNTPTPTPTPVPNIDAAQALYNNITTKQPLTIQGFQNNKLNWENDGKFCQLPAGDIYHAKTPTSGYYATCMAQNSQYKNFAYQVTLTITNNNVGGVIFRADNSVPDIYYIFSITAAPNGNDEFSTYFCRKIDCKDHVLSNRQQLSKGNVVNPGSPITLTVIAQDSKVNLYVQGKPVGDMDNIRPIVGKIGFYAASVNDKNPNTDVTFSDLKIWSLGQ